MKYLFLLGILLPGFTRVQSQAIARKTTDKALQVGKNMPALVVKDAGNNTIGLKRLSDLKGKLVILDFWSTGCPDCIMAFPEMDKLQQKFNGKVQVLLVNAWDTKENIDRVLRMDYYERANIRFPDVPAISGPAAKKLLEWFPHEGNPYHVWVGPDGKVVMKGSEINTHNEQKIIDAINGKPFAYIRNDRHYDVRLPYYTLIKDADPGIVKSMSLITEFSDAIANMSNDSNDKQIDSLHQTVRMSFININLLQLFEWASYYLMQDMRQKNLNESKTDRISLEVGDSSRYSFLFKPWKQVTDESFRKVCYSYEQIVPLGLSDSLRYQIMLEDLNRYFKFKFGTVASLEESIVPCYALVRVSAMDQLKTVSPHANDFDYHEQRDTLINGRNMRSYINCPLDYVMRSICSRRHDSSLLGKKIFLDETGYQYYVDITLPDPIKGNNDLEDLRTVLQSYGLDIVQRPRKIRTFLIRDNSQ
jgi:thiol-disulfide isomerase/thioredoxin